MGWEGGGEWRVGEGVWVIIRLGVAVSWQGPNPRTLGHFWPGRAQILEPWANSGLAGIKSSNPRPILAWQGLSPGTLGQFWPGKAPILEPWTNSGLPQLPLGKCEEGVFVEVFCSIGLIEHTRFEDSGLEHIRLGVLNSGFEL